MLALAIIQAGDQTSSPRFVLLVTIGAVFAGGLIGAMVATTVMTRRGIPVRRPRSRARFVAIFGIALLLWLILSLLAPRLGLHSPYLGAALFALSGSSRASFSSMTVSPSVGFRALFICRDPPADVSDPA